MPKQCDCPYPVKYRTEVSQEFKRPWTGHTLNGVHALLWVGLFVLVFYNMLVYHTYLENTSNILADIDSTVSGALYTSDPELPPLYKRFWDNPDLVVSSHESKDGESLIRTNLIITPNQTRGVCLEDINVPGASCESDGDCPPGKILGPDGHGSLTGKCVDTLCQINAWCPTPSYQLPLKNGTLFKDVVNFTVTIKNTVRFPDFMGSGGFANNSALMEGETCLYHNETNKLCPNFRIGDIIEYAGGDFDKTAIHGGVLAINLNWDCDLTWGKGMEDCKLVYDFSLPSGENLIKLRTLGDKRGYEFSTSIYHEDDRRTHIHSYGLKIIVNVQGKARRLDWQNAIIQIGSGFGLVSLAGWIVTFVTWVCCWMSGGKFHAKNTLGQESAPSILSSSLGSVEDLSRSSSHVFQGTNSATSGATHASSSYEDHSTRAAETERLIQAKE
ncbi:P2X purinoceptor 5 [Folsomia candida]|uniref:P2X purinoceptor 5 n=1 Tax=Folsomia candida TaxID=158441 RepID=UPI000B8F913B|nr:P2X purinoceptor 5 [Folsomia candida]